MNPTTQTRYRPLVDSVEQLWAAISVAVEAVDKEGPFSEREALACEGITQRALAIATMAAELAGNGDDPASRLLARIVVASNAADAAREAAPFPLDVVSGHVHSAAQLLEIAGEEFVFTPVERRRV